MDFYKTKIEPIPGTDFTEVHKRALVFYSSLKGNTRRRAYVRSSYFNKEKVFLELFWRHLYQKKSYREKIKRMKMLPCAIDLVQRSFLLPTSKTNPNKTSEKLHRFGGITAGGKLFFVQVKEDLRTNEKWLMSAFPVNKRKKSFR